MKKTNLICCLCILFLFAPVIVALSSSDSIIGLDPSAQTAFQQGIYRANQRIANFEKALESGNRTKIRSVALELQKDPLAVRQVNNLKSDSFKTRLNIELKAVQIKTKILIKRQLAKRYNVPTSAVTFFEATNPSNEIKVGQDWDVTAQVNGKDVPLEVAKKITHESFYIAAKGQNAPSAKAATHFAESQSVEVTNRAHAEAYGGGGKKIVYNRVTGKYEVMTEGGEIIVGDKRQPLRDPEQLSKVMGHKSDLAGNNAKDMRQAGEALIKEKGLQGKEAARVRQIAEADAQAWELEQARQYTKQVKSQVKPRVAARGGIIDNQVVEGTKILNRVAKGEISPAEGRAQLKTMGETPESIIQKGSSQIEAAQKAKDSPSEILKRAKAGKSPKDVFVDNVKDSMELKKLQAGKQKPKSLIDGGKSSFKGDAPPPEYKPKANLKQVRAKAEAVLQAEKLRTGKSINRPASVLDGGKASVGNAETPVVQGSKPAKAVNAEKGLVKSGSQKSKPVSSAGSAASVKGGTEAAVEPLSGRSVDYKPRKGAKTGIRGPSAKNTNPGGQLGAMGIPDNRSTLTPEQAGVKMPGRIDPKSAEGLNKPKRVKGDPKLAELAHPKGQKLKKDLPGNKGLADQAKGQGKAAKRGKMKTGMEPVPENPKTPGLQKASVSGQKPASLLDGGKASSSHVPKPPSKIVELDKKLGNKIQKSVGLGEIPQSASSTRKNVTKYGDKTMAAVAVVATAAEGGEAGHTYGEGLRAKIKAARFRENARKARELGIPSLADRYDKRAEQYEKEASIKMSKGLKDEAALVGTLAAAATATGGAALGAYGTYKTGEASYGAAKSLSEKMLQEEYAKEIKAAQKEGREPDEAAAKARALARIAGEASGARWVMEKGMTDSKAEQAVSEMDKQLAEKRGDVIADLDWGLHEIVSIERKLRNLDKNANQDSSWVKEERSRLLQDYSNKRQELQKINDRLGEDAGKGDGEAIAIRTAVELLPDHGKIPPQKQPEAKQEEQISSVKTTEGESGGKIQEKQEEKIIKPSVAVNKKKKDSQPAKFHEQCPSINPEPEIGAGHRIQIGGEGDYLSCQYYSNREQDKSEGNRLLRVTPYADGRAHGVSIAFGRKGTILVLNNKGIQKITCVYDHGGTLKTITTYNEYSQLTDHMYCKNPGECRSSHRARCAQLKKAVEKFGVK